MHKHNTPHTPTEESATNDFVENPVSAHGAKVSFAPYEPQLLDGSLSQGEKAEKPANPQPTISFEPESKILNKQRVFGRPLTQKRPVKQPTQTHLRQPKPEQLNSFGHKGLPVMTLTWHAGLLIQTFLAFQYPDSATADAFLVAPEVYTVFGAAAVVVDLVGRVFGGAR